MSNSPEFLDVDAVAPRVKKVIKINGKKHEFVAPNVATFIREMQRVKEMQVKARDSDEDAQLAAIEIMVVSMQESVRSAFPSVSEEDVNLLNLDQLKAIQSFVSAQVETDSVEAEDAMGNG